MSGEGPLEHYLAVSHEPEPEPEEPVQVREAKERGPWRERGAMLGLGLLLGGIIAYAVCELVSSGRVDDLRSSLAQEREAGASLQKERSRLLEALDQARMDSLLEERTPLSVAGGGLPARPAAAIPQPPPLTPLPGNIPAPAASVAARLANPGPDDWKERYQYAALKYNRVVADYNKLRSLYMDMTGRGGAADGLLVTGAQFYRALRHDTRVEMRKLDEKYSQGLRSSELKEVERGRDEMRHRDWWLKKMANKFKID